MLHEAGELEEVVLEKEMKCPSCLKPMKMHYRAQGGVLTHEWFECEECKLHVTIFKIAAEAAHYEGPITMLKKWREEKRK